VHRPFDKPRAGPFGYAQEQAAMETHDGDVIEWYLELEM